MAVAPDLEVELVRERVHAAHAHAVQSARDFVVRGVEFSARVQRGEHDLRGGKFFSAHYHVINGDPAAIIDDGDGVINVNGDFDLGGVTGKRFVNGIVHDFVDEVMQSHLAIRADVHGGAQAHGFHTLKDFNVVGGVLAVAPVCSN